MPLHDAAHALLHEISICSSEMVHSFSHSRAENLRARALVASAASSTAFSALFWKFIACSTAETRSSKVST